MLSKPKDADNDIFGGVERFDPKETTAGRAPLRDEKERSAKDVFGREKPKPREDDDRRDRLPGTDAGRCRAFQVVPRVF